MASEPDLRRRVAAATDCPDVSDECTDTSISGDCFCEHVPGCWVWLERFRVPARADTADQANLSVLRT